MVRFIDRQVQVKHDGKNAPLAFFHDTRWFPISQVLEIWKDTGTWWDGEAEKTFYRVEAAAGSLFELYLNSESGTWFLYRIYD